MNRRSPRKFVWLLVLMTLVSTGAAIHFYGEAKRATKTSSSSSSEDIQDLIIKVGKLMAIPSDEQPTIATVEDPERLKGKPFFAHAQRGNKVLMFAKAKKAILYDPEGNKIIEVAPLASGEAPSSESTK